MTHSGHAAVCANTPIILIVHKYSARSSVSFTVLNLLTHTVRQLWIGTPTAMMASILEKCAGARRQRLLPGAILLSEGETSGRLYVLAEGSIEVLRGNTQVALIAEPGAIFGEMSVLLNRPHTATVKAASKACVFVFDNAERFLKSNPEIAFLLGRLLAERLNAATTYLVDLKRQFEGHTNHLGMVGEVLESLIHQQHETITLDPEREADPRL